MKKMLPTPAWIEISRAGPSPRKKVNVGTERLADALKAAIDAVGLALDVGALALPGIPGGAGLAIKAAKYGDDVVQVGTKAASAIAKTDNVVDAGKGVVKNCTCFVPGTDVMVAEGEAAIESLEPGDEVLSYDPSAEGDWVPLEPEPPPWDPTVCDPEVDPRCGTQAIPVEVDHAGE